jgi:predicted DNA-binding protein
VQLLVKLSPQQRERLRKLAEREGTTSSALVRQFIDEKYARTAALSHAPRPML